MKCANCLQNLTYCYNADPFYRVKLTTGELIPDDPGYKGPLTELATKRQQEKTRYFCNVRCLKKWVLVDLIDND